MKTLHELCPAFSPPLTSSPASMGMIFQSDARSWICHSAIKPCLALMAFIAMLQTYLLLAPGGSWIGRQHAAD